MSGFLRRWADRKAAAGHEAEPKDAAQTQGAEAHPEPAAALSPEALAEKLAALPALETIGPETDVRPFLQAFVPAALRNAALRRAWAADPIISTHLDVARDYAWEFNSGPLPVGFSRSLGADAVQRSLDALGEIGVAPANSASRDSSQDDAAPTPDAVTPTALPAATAAEKPAPRESDVTTSPEVPEIDCEVSKSTLFVRPRHGSALPD